jgi:uncharacterized membrane-anchored protein
MRIHPICGLMFLFLFTILAKAEDAADKPLSAAEQEAKSAFESAINVMQGGPRVIALGNGADAKLNIPAGYGFIPKNEAGRFMRAIGNQVDDRFQGLIVPSDRESGMWIMDVSYNPEGYIKDDDAKDWNPDDLLKSMKEGADESNKDRAAKGIPEIEVVGWVEKPQYDASTHRLVWSLAVRDKGQVPGTEEGVNYNTLMLGRAGFISMNLITGRSRIDALKPVAKELLAGVEFDNGKKYADFNAETDKVAEYGLAALVAGVAAKKLGLLAIIAAFVAKFAKVLIIAAAAGVAGLGKIFGKKKST